MDDYWTETIEIAFKEEDIIATKEQIENVAGMVEVSAENYGMSMGHNDIPSPVQLELEKIKEELKEERNKIVCPICRGKGNTHGTRCFKCIGRGISAP